MNDNMKQQNPAYVRPLNEGQQKIMDALMACPLVNEPETCKPALQVAHTDTDLRKAAQDVVDAERKTHIADYSFIEKVEALRAALQPDPMQRLTDVQQEMEAIEAAKQRLLEIMRKNGLATGHGDTLKQVIDTLEVELTDMLAAARSDAARYRWVRDHASRDWLDAGITDDAVDEAINDKSQWKEQKK